MIYFELGPAEQLHIYFILPHFICTECHFFTAVKEKVRTGATVSVLVEKAKLPFDFAFAYSNFLKQITV